MNPSKRRSREEVQAAVNERYGLLVSTILRLWIAEALRRRVFRMSYDLYCYRATSGIPDVGEARAFVEAINAAEEAGNAKTTSSDSKERITAALIEHNPRLERFKVDYSKIAESQKVSADDVRSRYQYSELSPPEGDLAIQLTVYDDHVFISIPYRYRGSEADQVFSQCYEYLRVIRRAAGFFAYDPQSDTAFDPDNTELRNHHKYEEVVKELPEIATEAKADTRWWKFRELAARPNFCNIPLS